VTRVCVTALMGTGPGCGGESAIAGAAASPTATMTAAAPAAETLRVRPM
jgi:hypothetical protein